MKKRKNVLFITYYAFVMILIAFPGPFDWANRIEPWVIGLPFSIFYIISVILLLAVGMIIQYFVEDWLGELDIEIEPLNEDTNIHETKEMNTNTNTKVGEV